MKGSQKSKMENQQDLQQQIDELKRRLDERDKQQITYPLDTQSIQVLQKYFMRITDTVLYIGGVAAKTFISYVGKQDDKIFEVNESTYVPYTVDPSTNIITITPGMRFRFVNDEKVYFVTEDTYPNPLNGIQTFYVIEAASDGMSFQVSLSPEYDAGVTYHVGDTVYYHTTGSSYTCKLQSLNHVPTNTTYWDLLALHGEVDITTVGVGKQYVFYL